MSLKLIKKLAIINTNYKKRLIYYKKIHKNYKKRLIYLKNITIYVKFIIEVQDMNGIIISDLETVIKRSSSISNNISSDINKIKNSCSNISSCLNGDVSFFSSKLNSDLQQFSKISNKINGYEIGLRGILKAYQLQDETISHSLK